MVAILLNSYPALAEGLIGEGKVCPTVCVPLYELQDGCKLNECGSGCGADNVNTFTNETDCRNRIALGLPVVKPFPEKLDQLILEKLVLSSDEIINVIVYTYGSPNQEMVKTLQDLGAKNVKIVESAPIEKNGVEEVRRDAEPLFITATIKAKSALNIAEQSWIRRIIYDLELTAQNKDDVFSNPYKLSTSTTSVIAIILLLIAAFLIWYGYYRK